MGHVSLKLAQWFGKEVENVNRRTDRHTMVNGRSEKITSAFNSGELKREMKFVNLFVCYSRLRIFQLSDGRHHYLWQGCKFRPMLGTHPSHIFCNTEPQFIRSHPKDHLIRRTGTHVQSWDSKRGRKDHQIASALTTTPHRHKIQWHWQLKYQLLSKRYASYLSYKKNDLEKSSSRIKCVSLNDTPHKSD
jgi:hypothetical protein